MFVVSSPYDGAARGIQATRNAAKELWHHNRLHVHHGNMICKNGAVYGSIGGFGPAPLTIVDAKSEEVPWQDWAFAEANSVFACDWLFVIDDDAIIAIAAISARPG